MYYSLLSFDKYVYYVIYILLHFPNIMIDKTNNTLSEWTEQTPSSAKENIVAATDELALLALQSKEKVLFLCKELAWETDEINQTYPKSFHTICVWPEGASKNLTKEDPKVKVVFTDKGLNVSIVRKNADETKRLMILGTDITDFENTQDTMKKFLAGDEVIVPANWTLDGGMQKTADMDDADLAEWLQYIKK